MADRIIYLTLVLLAVLGLVGYFVPPAYPTGVWVVILCLTNIATGCCSAKFTAHIPKPDPPVDEKRATPE